jgi:hypothetical protein
LARYTPLNTSSDWILQIDTADFIISCFALNTWPLVIVYSIMEKKPGTASLEMDGKN